MSQVDDGAHGMIKIRINELARELEVKPNVILDLLPVLGVTEKKTHSSSIDEPVAIEIKRRLIEGENGTRTADAPEPTVEHVHEAAPIEAGSRRSAGERKARRHRPFL